MKESTNKYYNKNRKRIIDTVIKRNYYNFIMEYGLKGRYVDEDKVFTENDKKHILENK